MADLVDLQTATVAGAAAGDIAVAGILLNDRLLSVQNVAAAGANLVDEFEITDDGTINNAGGTVTTGMILLVIWQKNYGGRNQFENATGDRQGRSKF